MYSIVFRNGEYPFFPKVRRWFLHGGFINRDLFLAGVLLHDIGKIKEFDLSPLGLVTKYSVEGQLMGRLVIGAQMVAEAFLLHSIDAMDARMESTGSS